MYAIENNTEYKIISAVLSTSDRLSNIEVDLKNVIVSFQIYENIEIPYLSADFVMIDRNNIIMDFDFQGGEKLEIEFQQVEELSTGNTIKKEFLIKSIDNTIRADETTDSLKLYCVEYHALKSSLQNVNRSYKGRPTSIISKLLNEYLEKPTAVIGNEKINDFKVIIPNLNPLQSAMWIKKRALSELGLPFYLYTALGVDNFILRDLGDMLSENPININRPFIFAPSLNTSSFSTQKFYNILDFKIEDTEDLLDIMNQGLVGSSYEFYDTTTATPIKVKFDVEDVFRELSDENKLGGSNERFVYAPDYKFNNKKFSQYETKNITQMSSTGAYRNGGDDFKSYQDEDVDGEHKKKVISESVKSFLIKSPIQITVKGREFMTGDNNYTIGRLIRILFLDHVSTTEDVGQLKFDTKKSGDYLVYAARHAFDLSDIKSTLYCGRLGGLSEDFVI